MLASVLLLVQVSGAASSVPARHPFTGTWRTVDTRMGTHTSAVDSPHRLTEGRRAVPPAIRELVIDETDTVVTLQRQETGGIVRSALPLSGTMISTVEAGQIVEESARRETSSVLLIRRTYSVALPGGPTVRVSREDRHTVLPDGTMRVESVWRDGTITPTDALIYRRAQ